MHEIVLPDSVKPALEWINNRVVPKVSPKPPHALAQARFATALGAWADERGKGMVGTEMHFQVRPLGEIGRTLVPDVAFVSFERVPVKTLESNEVPHAAPDVVVEVRSPDDLQADIDEKVRVYLASGTRVLFLVDPERKDVQVVDVTGLRVVREPDVVTHESLEGFSLPVATLFRLRS